MEKQFDQAIDSMSCQTVCGPAAQPAVGASCATGCGTTCGPAVQPAEEATDSVLFARKPFVRQVTNLVNARFRREDAAPTETRNAADLYDRLKTIKDQF